VEDLKEISYKIIFRTPMLVAHSFFGSTLNTKTENLKIPSSVLMGASRAQFFNEENKNPDFDLNLLFGTQNAQGNCFFTDAVCKKELQIENRNFVSFNRTFGRAEDSQLYSQGMIPAGTEFVGKVGFTEKTSGFQRSIALSRIMDISNLGARTNMGFGECDVQLVDWTGSLVFISYSWENSEHIRWVLTLVKRLIATGVDVLLDRLCPDFNEKAPQSEINQWMTQAINNCDKIIAVLTPNYKQKAEQLLGGVGYEYSQLMSEYGKLSPKLKRYIGALRKGNMKISIPHRFSDIPVFDVRTKTNKIKESDSLIKSVSIYSSR